VYQRLCKIVLALAAGGVWLLNMARAESPAAPTNRPYQVQWIWCHVESPQPFQFGVGGILTEEVLGIRLGFPLRITPHNGGTLQSCRGFITTPKGRVQVAWEVQQDRYQLQASLPRDVTAEVVLPPEAKAVWQSAPATSPWRETLTVRGATTTVVAPGKVQTL
jgi:hypothetical protein